MKAIRITCKGASLVPLDKLEPLQPEAFKTLSDENYKRLKAAILEVGFSFPELVWKSRSRFYIVDGHQRVRAVQRMIEEGHKLPGGKLPVSFTEARNKKEAYKKIGMGTSQYGEYTEAAVFEFMELAELKLEEFEQWTALPQIDYGTLSGFVVTDAPMIDISGDDVGGFADGKQFNDSGIIVSIFIPKEKANDTKMKQAIRDLVERYGLEAKYQAGGKA